jgi:phosphocarrier protein FPr
MQQLDLVIHNVTGLHARPARVLVDIAKQYRSTIRVRHGEKQANAKSLISILTLGVTSGQSIQFDISGEDEEAAANALSAAVRDGLGEGPASSEPSTPAPAPVATVAPGPLTSSNQATNGKVKVDGKLQGVPGAPGIAVGPLYCFIRAEIKIQEHSAGVEQEQRRLQKALEAARQQLAALGEQVLRRGGASEAAIFAVHRDLLDDATLLEMVQEAINQGQSAAEAWQRVIAGQAAEMAKLSDPVLAERATDLRDVGTRVLGLLTDTASTQMPQFSTPVIVAAYDLTPSETAAFDPENVLGFCTAVGGPNAHTAILARAMGLPAVVSAGPHILDLASGTPVILNGNTGTLTIAPDPSAIEEARLAQQRWQEQKAAALQNANAPAITLDGHRVEIVANIGGVADAQQAIKAGAEGVGLFRTEFLFLDRASAPTEDEQFQVYCEVVRTLQGQPVIIRTLDIGGDKPIAYLKLPAEDNPFLGQRGIRLCLAYPELFKTQLRAILRAAPYGKLRIMFPMVADVVELRAAKALVEEIRRELDAPPVEIGIMIEIPSAALLADSLAAEVDFFSIGTNDLTQYTLAMDRTHPALATRADGLHPAVLRLIARTVEAAHHVGKWVGICGELGADAQAVPVLVGLGVDELSVGSRAIPAVKAQVRTLTLTQCRELAQQALNCATAEQVRKLGKE